jgi:predicted DNA-binding transcriptional regulator AlpA
MTPRNHTGTGQYVSAAVHEAVAKNTAAVDDRLSPASADPVLGPPAVSEWLGISEHTLAQWRSTGKGPRYFRLGKHARYLASDVTNYMLQQREMIVASRVPASGG